MDTDAEKPYPTPEQKYSAVQTVICTLMAFQPRDPLEAMMAGQCVVYDHLMRDGARDILRGQTDDTKNKGRRSILATGKVFLETMRELTRMQARPENTLTFARQLLPAVMDTQQTEAEP